MAEGGVGHEGNDFSPDFRKYMKREHYGSSRVDAQWTRKDPGWVFWDRRDGYPDLTIPNYHSLDFNPNLRIRLKMRGALRKLMGDTNFARTQYLFQVTPTLFQFWAPIKTVEGRTYLTVQNQPFAFGFCNSGDLFGQYRTRICNLLFDAHAECAEEQLGLPARVFLRKLPESAPYPSYNTLDLASRHRIKATWALPVFENNYSDCVGVLEIASCSPLSWCWDSLGFLHRMREIFQEFGLSCLDEYKHRIMQWEYKDEARLAAFKELGVACKSLWVIPEGYFGTFRLAYGQEWGEELPLQVNNFQEDRKIHYIEKIPATGCTPDPEFLKDEPVALQLGLPYQPSTNGCIPSLEHLKDGRVMLQLGYQPSVHTLTLTNGSEAQNSNSPSLVSLPNGIEVMRVDSSDQKSHSIETIPATGCIPSQRRAPSVDSVNNGRYVCTEPQNSYTLSDPSRDSLLNDSDPSHNSLPNDSDPNHESMPNGIEMMQVDSSDQASVDPSNSFEDQEQSMELNSDDRASAIGTFRNPRIQDANTVTIKAKVENYDYIRKFSLSSTPRLEELQQEVAKRNIDPGAYDIFCTDEGEKPIGCDYDLQQWIKKSTLLGNTSITVTLRLKQPTPT